MSFINNKETKVDEITLYNTNTKTKSKKSFIEPMQHCHIIPLIKRLLILILIIPIFSEQYIYINIGSSIDTSYRILRSSGPSPSKIIFSGNEISYYSSSNYQQYYEIRNGFYYFKKNTTSTGVTLYYSSGLSRANSMFQGCDITYVGFSSSDSNSISNFNSMFSGCYQLTQVSSLPISSAELLYL